MWRYSALPSIRHAQPCHRSIYQQIQEHSFAVQKVRVIYHKQITRHCERVHIRAQMLSSSERNCSIMDFKRIVRPQMKILSSFIHRHAISNLCDRRWIRSLDRVIQNVSYESFIHESDITNHLTAEV